MILFENTLISLEIFKQQFICDLPKCQGRCCYEGDYGAPLEEIEIEEILADIDNITPYMTGAGKQLLDEKGFFESDPTGDFCTTCISEKDCVFSYTENGIYRCAIEQAYINNKIQFRKPISCHLYPIRLGKVKDMTTLNYNEWSICKSAIILGQRNGMPLFRFLQEALIRKFGENYYSELENIYSELKQDKEYF